MSDPTPPYGDPPSQVQPTDSGTTSSESNTAFHRPIQLLVSEYLRTETTTSLPPYEITLPRTERGNAQEDLASMERTKSYLLLLSSWSQLLEELTESETPCHHQGQNHNRHDDMANASSGCDVVGCDGLMSQDCVVGLFVEMAVRRFGIWQEKVLAKGNASLPPPDVLLVWMTYLSSPSWSVWG